MRPVLITGGGTGGHVFPMQAIAEELMSRGVSSHDVYFVGSRRGQEGRLLRPLGIRLVLLPGRGISRSLLPTRIFDNLVSIAGLIVALLHELVMVGWRRPSAVVSVGGYASLASVLAALFWRRPIILVELDAHASAAQRVVLRAATRRCVPFLVDDGRAVVTGVPLREVIRQVDRSALAEWGSVARTATPFTIVVMTGSLGARRVNQVVTEFARDLTHDQGLRIIHVTGSRDFSAISLATRGLTNTSSYEVCEFGDMARLWAVADLAVCRAGAITIGEITALGIPSILVPLPGAPADHQSKNARVLVDAGAAILIRDEDLTASVLAREVDHLRRSPETLSEMSRCARELGRLNAAAAIADVILEVVGR